MNYNYIFKDYKVDNNKLKKYGFNNGIYQKDLKDNLLLIIEIKDNFIVKVIDKDFNEEIPGLTSTNPTSHIIEIKEEVEKQVKDIIKKCFINESMTLKTINYIKDKYNVDYETPWDKYPLDKTFKSNNKWFALIMNIKGKNLELAEENINVINLKLEPSKIDELIDNIHFFRAYHMNKEKWITILLDNKLEEKLLYHLIDLSYNEVSNSKSNNEWVIPANPKYYDVVGVFENNDYVEWTTTASIKIGDYIYMYVSAPYKAILYKGEVVGYDNDLIRVKVLKRYPKDKYNYEFLKKYGLTSIRSKRRIPKELSKVID